jgi:2-isopropylmalate synthase
LRYEGKIYSGHAANTDIIVASARAYVGALNRLCAAMQQRQQQESKAAV